MSTLFTNVRSVIVLMGLLACLATEKIALADNPAPVLRTFGFLVLDGQVPDFLSEDSLAITVLPDVTDPGAGASLPLLVNGILTNWELHPAHYAARSGTKISGDFFWLLDDNAGTLPPVGAHTFSGDRGFIQSMDIVMIRPCVGNDCGCYCNDGLWTIDNDFGYRTLVIVTAWFSK